MAVTSTRVATRIRLADDKKKTICTYSGINPLVTPDGAQMFSEAVGDLQKKLVNFHYLICDDELTESGI